VVDATGDKGCLPLTLDDYVQLRNWTRRRFTTRPPVGATSSPLAAAKVVNDGQTQSYRDAAAV
jgi:hypothetical protein